jgi:hypothetical protein
MNQPYDHIKQAGGLSNLARSVAGRALPTPRRSTKVVSLPLHSSHRDPVLIPTPRPRRSTNYSFRDVRGLHKIIPFRPNPKNNSEYLAWLESQLKPRSGNPYSAGDPNWFVNNYGSNFNISDLTSSNRSSAFTLPSRFNSPASLIDGVIHRGFTTPAQQHRRVYGNEGSDAIREFAVRHHMANPESQSLFASAYPDRRWYKPIELLEDPIPQYRLMGYRPKSETLAGFEGGDHYAPFGGGPAIMYPAGLNRYTGSVKSLMGMPSPQDLYRLNAPTALHEAVGHGTQWDELYPNLFDAQRALRARDINGAISPFSPTTNYLEEPKSWLETVYGHPGPHRGYTLRPVELHPHVTEMKGVKYLVDGELPLMDTDAKIKQWQTWWQDNLKSQKMESSHTATESILSPDFYQQRYGAILDLFRQYPDEAANILRGTVRNNLQTNPLDSSIPVSLGDNDKYASLNYNASVNQPYAHIKQAGFVTDNIGTLLGSNLGLIAGAAPAAILAMDGASSREIVPTMFFPFVGSALGGTIGYAFDHHRMKNKVSGA